MTWLGVNEGWIPDQVWNDARLIRFLGSDAAIGFAKADFFGLNEGEGGLGGVDSGVGDLGGSIGVECDSGEGVSGNLQGLVGAVDESEERFFDQLEIAVVAGGHFERDVLDGLEVGGSLGTVGADEFEDIGVALLRHDA